MARTINCPAGEWTTIFDHAFVQIPQSWTVTFGAADGSAVAGDVEEKRSTWIFPNPPTLFELRPVMVFERGWWTTFYRVRVRPTTDLTARID
jgi:hypothetical protein